MSEITRTLKDALQLYDAGRIEETDKLCSQILHADPSHLKTLYLAGVVALQSGRLKQAYDFITRAVAVHPFSPCLQNILGLVLTEMGKFEIAVEAFQTAILIDPHYGEAYCNLGNTLKALGKIKSAIKQYGSAVRLKPQWAEAHYNMAIAHQALGQIDDAMACYQKAIKLNPGFLDAYINLGVIYQEKGELNRAMTCHQTALKLDPTCSDAINNIGLTYRALGKIDQAISCFKKAVQFNPNCVDALNNMGHIFQEYGEMNKAKEVYMLALSIQSDSIEAYYQLAKLDSDFDRKSAIAKLESINQKKNLSMDQTVLLHFTLGSMYADIGNYEKAFYHYQFANELDKELTTGQFNFKDVERQILLLINAFDTDFFYKRKHFGVSSQLPVFIVGMPRSGTTLVEQIISSHPLVFGAGELQELKQIEENLLNGDHVELFSELLHSLDESISNDLAQQYLTQLRSYSKEAIRITDKYPHNFMRLWLIALLFPNAKIIHCRRDPVDTCLSCYFTKFNYGHAYKNDLKNLGLYYGLYQRLMDHWHRVLPLQIFDVQYEDLVENQNDVSRKIIEFCELNWEDCCLEFYNNDRPVLTASFSQVRRKIYTTSSGRWKRYEKYLDELLDSLKCNQYPDTPDNPKEGLSELYT
jgi:tetratricopeptide (TPR) repeat protein